MKKTFRTLIAVACIIGGIASFLYLCLRDRDIIGEYYARSSVNVEIDKSFADNIAIAVETSPNPCAYWLSPTTLTDSSLKNIIMYKSIPLKRPYWNPAIQLPRENADAAIAAVDNIAFFVGNKLFYFTQNDIKGFRRIDKGDYALFYIPGIYYVRSLVFRNWSNYYGDFNFAVKAITAFLLYPARFAPVYLFIGLLLFLYRKRFYGFYAAIKRKKNLSAAILLILIVTAGFILRINGYVRHSGWTDEIYSAVRAGNPALPFITTFTDPGNPPFYFILLRFWFMIFGWSEESGTMLSVILGTCSVITLYLLVRPFFGRKAALCAALFVAFSGFSIGYSQEMRSYILQMALAPLISLAVLSYIKKPSLKNLLFYILPSLAMANAHFYGILFIMANFLFYAVLSLFYRQWQWKRALRFLAANVIVALSFLPYFFYMILFRNFDFKREFSPGAGHALVVVMILLFFASLFIFRKEIAKRIAEFKPPERNEQLLAAYLITLPAFIFILAFVISFVRPMIAFRYLWPISAPYCLALAACVIIFFHAGCFAVRKQRVVTPFLIFIFIVGLYGIIPDIPSGGTEGYREARAYIAADAAAHPGKKAAMLDNAPANAAYYRYPQLPLFVRDAGTDVLYVYNDIFKMHENDMYAAFRPLGLSDSRMLKVYFDYEYPRADGGVIFKYQF